MPSAVQEVRTRAAEAAARHLEQAATFAALHGTSKSLFRKLMRLGSTSVLVCFDWPGVLRVYDPTTGELLCESEPGRPNVPAVPRR